ncbi:hypothetical protein ACFZCG_15455 [Streptomyces tanashiensis]|uniref:hypothetical protein n=1 Tax=Streptomyces tanashiensis TaxID=67367 RepID=UPI0036E8D576
MMVPISYPAGLTAGANPRPGRPDRGREPEGEQLVHALVLLLRPYVGALIGVAVTGTPTSAPFDTAQDTDLSRWVIVGTGRSSRPARDYGS